MSGTKRQYGPGLIDELRQSPNRFEFFQAVRILLAHGRTERARKGMDLQDQKIRFRSSVSLSFPASEIESLEWEEQMEAAGIADIGPAEMQSRDQHVTGNVRLTPSLIGLTGPCGVLPGHYTQHIADRALHHGEEAGRDFLDIFASRAIALYFQAWMRARPYLEEGTDDLQRFSLPILSLAGIGLSGMHRRLLDGGGGIADASLAYYAAALRQRPRSLAWFARVVAHYFNTDCKAEQFAGQWLHLPDSERTVLGHDNCRLGTSATCGDRFWSREFRVKLTIGPLRRAAFGGFLPGHAAERRLRSLIRIFTGASLDYEIRLRIDRRDASPIRLASNGSGRLGWTCWLGGDASSMPPGYPYQAGYLIPASEMT